MIARWRSLLMALVMVAGCSSPTTTASPNSAPPAGGGDDHDGPRSDDLQKDQQEYDGGTEPVTEPAGDNTTATATPIEWTGSVPATSFFPFGPDECRFSARFENVVVHLTLQGDKVVAANITAKDVEKLSACAYNPKPTPRSPADHTWSLPTAEATTSVVMIPGDGLSDLSVEVGLDGDSAWASLSWKRVGVGDPYDWTIGPQWVNLTKK